MMPQLHEHHSTHGALELLNAYADGVPTFASSLPGVREVMLVEGTEDQAVLHRVHRWRGDPLFFPARITARMPEHLFEWTTHCTWDRDTLEGIWALRITAFGAGPHIRGLHRFVPLEQGTRVEVEGVVLLHSALLKTLWVPSAVQGVVERMVQRLFQDIVGRSGEVVDASLD